MSQQKSKPVIVVIREDLLKQKSTTIKSVEKEEKKTKKSKVGLWFD